MHPHLYPPSQKTRRYEPLVDMWARWPGWQVQRRPLEDAAEVITPDAKLVLLDCDVYNEDPELALAHAIAHLDLHMGSSGDFTEQQCQDADFYAELRLDRMGWLEAV